MRRPELFSTTTFRWALAFAAVFSGGVLLLALFIYWQTVGYLTHRVDLELERNAQQIAHATPDKRPELIERYLKNGDNVLRLAGIFGSAGRPEAGNLQFIPANLPVSGKVVVIRLPVKAADRPQLRAVRALALTMSGGETLVLERSPADFDEISDIITRALALALVPALLLALTGGWLLSRGAVNRIAAVHRASRLIMAGKLGERLPTRGTQDDFDKLARIVNEMLDEIERLMTEAKGVGEDIAHDLRTPLTRLRTRIERVLEALPSTGEASTNLSSAIEDIDQVLVTIKAILRIAEVEHGERRGGFRDVDLNDVLQEAVDLYEPIAEAKGIDLVFSEAQANSTRGDADLLFEAISNLLDNAIKFTPPRGSVEVLLQREPRGPSIRVSDTGPGIAPEDFPKLLRRFQRGDRSRGTPGTGLGLSLVAAIARLHGFGLAQRQAERGCCIELQCWPHEPLSTLRSSLS